MIEADVASTQNEFHTYALNWTSESLTWLIDNKPMRTLNYADANGGKNFPQTPCNVRLGNWPGGDSENEGTVQWAGGKVDYTKGPFNMTVASIKVINYSPGTEYHWKDKTGSFESIEVVGAGNKDGAPQNTAVLESSASATGSGAPLESGFAAPTATGGVSNGTSTTCTEEQQGATPAPSNLSKTTATAASGGNSDFNYPVPTGGVSTPAGSASTPVSSPSGGSSDSGTDGSSDDTPCECGTATVTVTGIPPSGDAPPATEVPSAPASSPVLGGVGSTRVASQLPATLTSVVSSAPYPTTGLSIETAPAPSVPVPFAPTGVLPPSPPSGGNATTPTTSALAQFTGAASANKASTLMAGAAVGIWLFAF